MNKDRLCHSISVGRKMVEIAKDMKLSETEIKNCFVIGIIMILVMNFVNLELIII